MTAHKSKVFGPTISQMLIDARLNPVALETLINLAVEEDLDGGVDVTTVATVPADQIAVLDLCARKVYDCVRR